MDASTTKIHVTRWTAIFLSRLLRQEKTNFYAYEVESRSELLELIEKGLIKVSGSGLKMRVELADPGLALTEDEIQILLILELQGPSFVGQLISTAKTFVRVAHPLPAIKRLIGLNLIELGEKDKTQIVSRVSPY